MGDRSPEDKLKEALLTLEVLALVERWVDDLDAARDRGAAEKIEELKSIATELVDFRRHQAVPGYVEMLEQAQETAAEYAVTPEARRRKFRVINGDDGG